MTGTVHAETAAGTWLLGEQSARFDLGHVLNSAVIDALAPSRIGELGLHHAGLWECDLSHESLIWSGGVYDIFGLERGITVTRNEALACYREESRAKLERLRSYALQHMVGFTIDVEIRPAALREFRRMRLIAAPMFEQNRATRLHGLKLAL